MKSWRTAHVPRGAPARATRTPPRFPIAASADRRRPRPSETVLRPQRDDIQILTDLHADRRSPRRRTERRQIPRPCRVQPVHIDVQIVEHQTYVRIEIPVDAD